MFKNFSILFAATVLVASLFTSCKKDEDRTALLVGKNWKLSALTVDPAIDFFGVQISDLYAQFETCDKDDILTFEAGGTLTFDEGASKCDSSEPQTIAGTWAFNTDETILTVDGIDWKIKSISGSKLVVSYEEDLLGTGVKNTITGTYTK
jgi:hypothetical protein